MCGYNGLTRQIIPITTTVDQTLFLGQIEALELASGRSLNLHNNIFEKLGLSETHKLLWQHPFGSPEFALSEITGLTVWGNKVDQHVNHKFSLMLYDFTDAMDKAVEDKERLALFIPRVFTVTYNKYQKIIREHPDLDPLKSIEQMMTFHNYSVMKWKQVSDHQIDYTVSRSLGSMSQEP